MTTRKAYAIVKRIVRDAFPWDDLEAKFNAKGLRTEPVNAGVLAFYEED